MEPEKKKVGYVEENGFKKMGIKRFLNSIKFSVQGLKYAYLHEQSFLLHFVITIIVIVCGVVFKITPIQWVIILVMLSLIVVAELFNTAIEAVVDMITDEYHPLAKVAKDTASGAVFISTLTAFGMWIGVFLPKIISVVFK